MTLAIEYEGILYSLLESPDVNSKLVFSKKQEIEGSIVLKTFAKELGYLTCFIQFTYFGITENDDIEDRVHELMTRITDHCEKWNFLMSQYITESSRAIKRMQNIYLYVVEGNESTAKEMIQEEASKISKDVIADTEKMQQELNDEVKFINGIQAEFKKTKKRIHDKKSSIKELEDLASRKLELESELNKEKEKSNLNIEKTKQKFEESRQKITEITNTEVEKFKEDKCKTVYEYDEKIRSLQNTKKEKESHLKEITGALVQVKTEHNELLHSWTALFNAFSPTKYTREKQEREKIILEHQKDKSKTEKDIEHCQDEINALKRKKETDLYGVDEQIQAIESQSALKITQEMESESDEISEIKCSSERKLKAIKRELEKIMNKKSDQDDHKSDHIKVESKIIHLAKKLEQCRDKEHEEDIALESLRFALTSLDRLQNIMKQTNMFWKNAQASIKRITKDNDSLSKRLQQGSSEIGIKDNKPFHNETIQYYASLTAFKDMCQTAQKSFMAVREQLYKSKSTNLTKEQAIQTALDLVDNI